MERNPLAHLWWKLRWLLEKFLLPPTWGNWCVCLWFGLNDVLLGRGVYVGGLEGWAPEYLVGVTCYWFWEHSWTTNEIGSSNSLQCYHKALRTAVKYYAILIANRYIKWPIANYYVALVVYSVLLYLKALHASIFIGIAYQQFYI